MSSGTGTSTPPRRWPTVCNDIKTYALPKAPQNPPSSPDVIAQSPTLAPTSRAVGRRPNLLPGLLLVVLSLFHDLLRH